MTLPVSFQLAFPEHFAYGFLVVAQLGHADNNRQQRSLLLGARKGMELLRWEGRLRCYQFSQAATEIPR